MRQWSGPCQHWAHVAHTRGAPLSTSSCSPPVVEAGRSATQRSGLPSRALHLALAVPAPSPCSRHATNGAPTGKRFSGPRPRRRLRGAERPGRRGRLGAPCQLGSRAGSRAHTGQRTLAEGAWWAPARQTLGDRVLRPFLQDTIRWWPLTVTMAGMLLAAPLTIARVLPQARPARAPCSGTLPRSARGWPRGPASAASAGWARVLVWLGACSHAPRGPPGTLCCAVFPMHDAYALTHRCSRISHLRSGASRLRPCAFCSAAAMCPAQ